MLSRDTREQKATKGDGAVGESVKSELVLSQQEKHFEAPPDPISIAFAVDTATNHRSCSKVIGVVRIDSTVLTNITKVQEYIAGHTLLARALDRKGCTVTCVAQKSNRYPSIHHHWWSTLTLRFLAWLD